MIRKSSPRRIGRRKQAVLEAEGRKQFSTIVKKSGKPKPNKQRAAKRLARTHGPVEFREFTKAQPCKACGRLWHSENAHVLGNDGMGRKGSHKQVAPLCGVDFERNDIGCHKRFDEKRWEFDAMFPEFDAAKAVAEHQAAWQAFTGEDDE